MEKTKITKKTILVSGGAGYLGSILVGGLLEKGYQVRVLDILMFGDESLSKFKRMKGFELVVGDIRDLKKVRQSLKGVWGVCHLASLVGEPACVVNTAASWEINVKGTKLLVTEAKKAGVERFIFPSTCSVYGKTGTGRAVDEGFIPNPQSLYAETKLEAEKRVLDSETEKFIPTVLRFGTCYGLSSRMRFNLLINQLTCDLALGKEIEIYRLSAWRPFIHIRDAAECFLKIISLNSKKASGEVFNVVGENKRRKDIVELLKRHFAGAKIKISDRKNDTVKRDYRVSAKKIARVLGFRAKRKIDGEIFAMKQAIEQGMIKNPQDSKYRIWVNKQML